jgi:hypothetical protein
MQLDIESHLRNAVAAGKFPESRKPVYRAMFDRDPDGTLRLIESLEPVALFAATSRPDETFSAARQAFPELRRRGRETMHAGPPGRARHLATPGVGVVDSQAAPPPAQPTELGLPDGWIGDLFPETRQRPTGRIARAD